MLNFFGLMGSYYAAFTVRLCDETSHELLFGRSSSMFFTTIKFTDILIAKFLLILFGWNMYVALHGYTHLEFKSIMSNQARKRNQEA